MKKNSSLLILLVLSFTIQAQQTIIRNVNLVDVKTGKIIAGQSVIINKDFIELTGPTTKIKTSADAKIIDGSGKYLMPGMTDAHIHFFQSGGLYTRPDAVDLRSKVRMKRKKHLDGTMPLFLQMHRYLRLGITTVMDVGGPMANFTIRDSTAKQQPLPIYW